MNLMRTVGPDLIAVGGFIAIGVGIAQWSRPGALIYAGLVLLGISYALSIVRRRPRP